MVVSTVGNHFYQCRLKLRTFEDFPKSATAELLYYLKTTF